MAESGAADRRNYIRLELHHMLRHERYVFRPKDQKNFEQSVLKNYSSRGALFESKTKYDIGDVLKLEITIPGWQRYKNEFYNEEKILRTEPVIILAKVVRVEALAEEGQYDIGVEFAGIDEGDRWALIKQIKSETRGR